MAETGHVDAQYELGVICAECDGELKDDVEALGWFRLAAEQRHAQAQHALVRLIRQWPRRGER